MRDRGVNVRLAYCLISVLNVKAVVAAFNQEKVTKLRMELFEALVEINSSHITLRNITASSMMSHLVPPDKGPLHRPLAGAARAPDDG